MIVEQIVEWRQSGRLSHDREAPSPTAIVAAASNTNGESPAHGTARMVQQDCVNPVGENRT
jgi:hypothetical protein